MNYKGLIGAALLTLAASLPSGDYLTPLPRVMTKKLIKGFEAEGVRRNKQAKEIMSGWSAEQTTVALKAELSNHTNILYQRGHGVYAEFTAANGKLLMWYPGNLTVVTGSWAVVPMDGVPKACFHYNGAVNPITGAYEPTECVDPVQTLSRIGVLASRAGDIFNLASGHLPYAKKALEVPTI
jgi:hypothetical protein